ncbi:conserved hypothetical protein [Leishmania major strain Friedlin]|uniref:Uncharacterized protein n=1 Tax=Leishmania major TaxID=5664 RepID=Q4Q5E4_LEIMA|nr:conserved hypothetical protein [Leishmania major strain Friedlin]CAG9580207.1 hypothetical_protein_-_conserved [Leishmania major strain Friedlin]CAJ08658.1 conserved hypothetical protein [Leishmania major strain Friedlin]|eukprot:XP_001685454.1 conserved hypothetical protein [Leishmania major strain Friedlin]
MDTSARRCFVEVYTDGCDEPRLLQLEPTVKFHNVLRRFDKDGDLYWGDHRIDPQTTPVAVGMDCGVDKANTLWFIPALPRAKPCGVSRVDSTAPLGSPPPVDATEGPALRPARGTSLPAYFDDRAAPWHSSGDHAARGSLIRAWMASASAATTPSWYSRPRLLSPVPLSLPRSAVRVPHTQVQPPSGMPTDPIMHAAGGSRHTGAPVAALEAHGGEKIAPVRRLCAAPAPRAPSPPHSTVPVRRNAPVCIDPHVLVDDTSDAVEALQTELRHLSSEMRAMRLRNPLDYNSVTPMRQVVVRPAGMDAAPAIASPICLSMAEPSVEELATELHDKQMHRLYKQRHLYLTHDFHV